MAVSSDDIWAMWALWHWKTGIVGGAYSRRRDLKKWLIESYFRDYADYRQNCGKGKPYRMIQVDVCRAK